MSDDNPVIVTDYATLGRLINRAVRDALEEGAQPLRLLTPEEAGDCLRVSPRTVIKWARTEGLPHRDLGPKVIRFVESEIVEWRSNRDERKAG